MHPFESLKSFNRQFSDAKDVFKLMQQWHIKNAAKDGVFIPSNKLHNLSQRLQVAMLTGVMREVSTIGNMNDKQYEFIKFLWGTHLFGAWRNTLGIYRIDPDIASDLIGSPIPEDTPANIFSRLPEWCVYVELPPDSMSISSSETSEDTTIIHGFWALFDIEDNQRVLNIVLNVGEPNTQSTYSCFQPLCLLIDDDITVVEAVEALTKKYNKLDSTEHLPNYEAKILLHLLSMLLWLCVDEPDISNIKNEPMPKFPPSMPQKRINKKTGLFVPPDQPIIYDIGKRLGGEIRSYKEQIEQGKSIKSSTKRPHIRKGHWHGVWHGKENNRQFKVYWQPAIFVNK